MDKILLLIFSLFVGLSGSFEFHLTGNTLVQDKSVRAITIILVLFLSIFVWITLKKRLGCVKELFIVPCVLLYMAGFALTGFVGSITSGMFYGGAQLVRFVSYFFVFWVFYDYSKHFGIQSAKKLGVYFTLPLFVVSVSFGLFDLVMHQGLNINNAFRITGNVGSPVGFATTMFVTALCLLLFRSGRHEKTIWMGVLIALLMIYFTYTRSIIFSYIFILLVVLMFKKGVSVYSVSLSLSVLLIMLVMFLLLPGFDDLLIFKRFSGFYSGDLSKDSSTSFRLFILDTVFHNVDIYRLLFGYGVGNFPNFFYAVTGIPDVAPHFEIIWLIMEYGLVGLFFYGLVLFRLFRDIKLNYKFRYFRYDEYLLLMLLLVSHFVFLQFANPLYFYQFGLPYAAALGVYSARQLVPGNSCLR